MTSKDLVVVMQKEVSPVIKAAEVLTITDAKDMERAAEMLSKMNTSIDNIEDEREKVTKPLNQALRAENARWKPLKDTLSSAIDIVRKKMGVYQLAAEKEAQKEIDKISNRVGEGRGHLKAETAADKILQVATPDAQVLAESGSVTFRTDHNVIIENKTTAIQSIVGQGLLDLLTIDEKALKTLLKDGTAIAGARLEEVKIPVNKR